MCETNNLFLDIPTSLFNSIYNSGDAPEDCCSQAYPKKPNTKYCKQHHKINLINHIIKVFTKIIHNQIYDQCEMNISESQFTFCNALSTREAVFSVQILIQRCRDVNKDVHLCFIAFSTNL